MSNHRITDNLDSFFEVLPPGISQAISRIRKNADLIEIILDLGRVPTARFVDGEVDLSKDEVAKSDIKYVVNRIGNFDADARVARLGRVGRGRCDG